MINQEKRARRICSRKYRNRGTYYLASLPVVPRSVPDEYDKFFEQPGILRSSCG